MNDSGSLDQGALSRLLRRNAILPVSALMLLGLLFVLSALYQMRLAHFVDHSEQALTEVNYVQQLIVDSETGMRGFLLSGDDEFLDPFRRSQSKLALEFAKLKSLLSEDAAQVGRAQQIQDRFIEWTQLAERRIAEKRLESIVNPEESKRGKARMDAIRAIVNAVLNEELEHRNSRAADLDAVLRWIVLSSAGFALLLGVALGYLGRKQLLTLTGTFHELLRNQTEQNKRLQDQAWINTGASQLSVSMQGDLPVEAIGQKVLEFSAYYLNSLLGVAYVLGANGKLARAAGYALPARVQESNIEFSPAESLIGQAFTHAKRIEIADLPRGYFEITSGLGSTEAKHLLISPLTSMGRPVGALELAFIHSPDSRALDLLEIVAEIAGNALSSAINRSHLEKLLTSSNQLNEELQQQQEELRVSNEELEQQSSALKLSQVRLEKQATELEQTNDQLEQQAKSLELQSHALDARNRDLLEKSEELARASQYKSEFLANMSHELRTPLNSSLILAKLLADNKHRNLTPEQVRFADTIYSAGNDLLNLINDILDLSKIEAGKMELRPEQVRIDSVKQFVDRNFSEVAAQKKLIFKIDIDPTTSPEINTDRQRLEQILRNFLSNAFKFTERGEVVIRIYPDGKGVAFAVKDSGIGIAPEQHKAVFEAFRQADGTTNRKYGGTGLGLSISRELATLLGGSITVESAEGQGSTFTLHMPARLEAAAHSASIMVAQPAPLRTRSESAVPNKTTSKTTSATTSTTTVGRAPLTENKTTSFSFEDDRNRSAAYNRKVLIIEDDERFARILYDLAHEMRFDALATPTAQEGIELAARFQPQAILLDVRLPDFSGLAALEQFKSDPKIRHIPVHMISAEDYSKAALQMGAASYTVKPADRDLLVKAFESFEAQLNQRMRRILVVEDDEVQRESMVSLIEGKDIQIASAGTAKEALDELRNSNFDCVVMDLNLPDMSGFELLEELARPESPYAHPPVIVYTGRDLSRDQEERLKRYSESIIIKGARSPERLLNEVTLFLHRIEADLPAERQKMLIELRNREKSLSGRKILVVDDDVRNIFALSSALESEGAQLEIARNGREAIEKLESLDVVDIVLMDIMMPEMDGYEATRRIRQSKKWANLPIIAVTAKAMKDDQEKCLQAGANDYLSKPLDIDKLLSLVRVWIPARRGLGLEHPSL